ncbi:MAG: TrmH family RNA methyltransferase [Rhodospirillales bacterium]|nr:TrmH family RNA methyltransferase [Rhodospirillales bacterium]
MGGYFGIGVEGASKALNVGTLFRSAQAFGAAFVFAVAAVYRREAARAADTSDAHGSMPFYSFPSIESMLLPKGCRLVGIEITPEAVDLPSFHHPRATAYILGPERGGLSPAMSARCDHIVRIPTAFSLNLAMAGVIVMYDRLLARGRFAKRPLSESAKPEALDPHVFGDPRFRRLVEPFQDRPPTRRSAED